MTNPPRPRLARPSSPSTTLRRFGSVRWLLFLGTVVFASASFAACGSSHGDDKNQGQGTGDASAFADAVDPNAFDLFFEPAEQTLTVDATGPKEATFVLKATSHGITREVTPEAVSFDRPDIAKLGNKSPITLTADGKFAGTGTLRGAYLGKEASAKLLVNVRAEEIGPGVDPAAITALKGSPLAADPNVSTLLYPYDATVWPLGLSAPLLMWNAPQANDTYRVHLEQSNYQYDGFFVVGAKGQQRITQLIWDRMTVSNAQDPLKLEVSRYDGVAKVAYASAKQAWTIAPASLRGAIYYWTTSAGGHMSSIRPGTGAAPTVLNGGKCMGCHAVSADGTTLVAAVDDLPPGRAWQTFKLPQVSVTSTSTEVGGNLALNPDGKFVVYGAPTLKLGDTVSGAPIPNSGLEGYALQPGNDTLGQPAFAPGGRLLAALEGKVNGNWHNPQGDGARMVLFDFDPASKQFTNARALALATQFPVGERSMAYPTFTPDSQWLAYHVGDLPTACEGGCDEEAIRVGRIWLHNVNGGAPIKLDRLNDSALNPADHGRTYEPTFNPVERGGYNWVVVTSSRDWGNELVGPANAHKKRLWVAAIDKTPGATDPSHPAFYLEGQEGNTTNMRGFWTLAQCTPSSSGSSVPLADAAVAPGACSAGFECCSGFCDQGVCIDVGQLQCVKTGGQCTKDDECCDSPSVKCISGVCKSDGPK